MSALKWIGSACLAVYGIFYCVTYYLDREYERANTREWNQKLTIEIQTPDGVRSGSSVTRIFWKPLRKSHLFFHPSYGRIWTQTGDGFAIDIGNKDYLFISIRNGSNMNMAELYFLVANKPIKKFSGGTQFAPTLPEFKGLSTPEAMSVFIKGKSWPLSVTQIPAAYRFRDLNDPLSVENVKLDELESAYGSGYSFKSARVDITNESTTCNSIETLLPWIRNDFKGALDGSRYGGKTVASNVHTGFFFTPGDCK